MIEVNKNIFVGNNYDSQNLLERFGAKDSAEWAVLHCCKTYHKRMLNYKKSLPKNDPNYLYFIDGCQMAINIVDMPYINDMYFGELEEVFRKAFDFIDVNKASGENILIHCDQGNSRGPFVAMLYLASKGVFDYQDFETTIRLFERIYIDFIPDENKNIYVMVKRFWASFVKEQ